MSFPNRPRPWWATQKKVKKKVRPRKKIYKKKAKFVPDCYICKDVFLATEEAIIISTNKIASGLKFHIKCFENVAGDEYIEALFGPKTTAEVGVNGEMKCKSKNCGRDTDRGHKYCDIHRCTYKNCQRRRYSPGISKCIGHKRY